MKTKEEILEKHLLFEQNHRDYYEDEILEAVLTLKTLMERLLRSIYINSLDMNFN